MSKNINQWLRTATDQLQAAHIRTARLDALLLLADELQQSKAWILAHPEQNLTTKQLSNLTQKLNRRAQREPLAYIRGHQEFYGRTFAVSPAVLTPRPETETIIDQLRSLKPQPNDKLIDIGTGSGALAITAKLEFPQLNVHATDISRDALQIAQKNAHTHNADIHFNHQNLLANDPHTYNIILANLPYVSTDWERSPETNHEPSLALFAKDHGQALIKQLLTQAPNHLTPSGHLLLEADPEQHPDLIDFAQKNSFKLKADEDYTIVLQK